MPLRKKSQILCFFIFFLSLSSSFILGKKGRIAFTVTGGSNYLAVGDSNRFLQGYNPTGNPTTVFKTFHYGGELSGKISYSLNRKLGIGLSSGFIQARRSENSYTTPSITWNMDIGIQAIPLEAFLEYRILRGKRISLLFQAGPGYYFAKWGKIYSSNFPNLNSWQRSESKAFSNGFGGHATFQFRYRIGRKVALVAECVGRYAPISGFKGSIKWFSTDSPETLYSRPGDLYYFRYNIPQYNLWFTTMDIHDRPIGPGVTELKKATVDFSGTAVRLGLSFSI